MLFAIAIYQFHFATFSSLQSIVCLLNIFPLVGLQCPYSLTDLVRKDN